MDEETDDLREKMAKARAMRKRLRDGERFFAADGTDITEDLRDVWGVKGTEEGR